MPGFIGTPVFVSRSQQEIRVFEITRNSELRSHPNFGVSGATRNFRFREHPEFRVPGFTRISRFPYSPAPGTRSHTEVLVPTSPGTPCFRSHPSSLGSCSHPELRVSGITRDLGVPDPGVPGDILKAEIR